MILNDILIQLTRIANALEKANGTDKVQELPANSKFEMLNEEASSSDRILQRELEAADKEGFMFPEDAVSLELLEDQ